MGTTPNLSLTYPAATALVSLGYQQIQTLAEDVDDVFGAWSTYTPTGNVNITSGTFSAARLKVGKIAFYRINIAGGTATAAGSIQVGMDPLLTPKANGGTTAYSPTLGTLTVAIGTGGTITIYGNSALGNFSAGASVACRMQFAIEVT